ncbi:hypothetical protein BKK51_01130 [Rodentibacter trehalosifermentans]|uniref:Uncharacterized protein n=1 Tax=Rodentibacter trehalosifermentans TaxID=1908263 RepID=A0A1V3IXK8_9PAST|nr:hypothetical protein [Rodentibacter trehalosifermentans]OOF46843.1 hypothetical protein BKK51_01130 [Rodentibacter trehalosifermentans]
MKQLMYCIFIVYVGLFASDLTFSFLIKYMNDESFSISREIFYKPFKYSVIGGFIMYVINKIFLVNNVGKCSESSAVDKLKKED